MAAKFPPSGPTNQTQVMKAYPYFEYRNDDNILGLFQGFNQQAQMFINAFNGLNLPVWTSLSLSGALLDWVGNGIYGIPRPVIPALVSVEGGAFNTVKFNTLVFNGIVSSSTNEFYTATDDVYRRCMTWILYRGDGRITSIPWIKKRIARWFWGTNGVDIGATKQNQIGIEISSGGIMTITIHTTGDMPTTLAPLFQAAIHARILPLPAKFVPSVVITA